MKKYFYILMFIFFFNFAHAQVNRQKILINHQAIYTSYVINKKMDTGKIFYNLKGSALFLLLPNSIAQFTSYEKLLDRSLGSQEELEVTVDMKKKSIVNVRSLQVNQK